MTYTDLLAGLIGAEIDLWATVDGRLRAAAGVSLSQFQALSVIGKVGETIRVQDISERLSITVGATSKLVDRLERDGLAARQSNPADRRSSIVTLTDAGRQSLSMAETTTEDHLRSLFGAAFSPQRATALAAELTAVRALLNDGMGS